jgi:3-mercaptopyruvate sulfurtransferase SseA
MKKRMYGYVLMVLTTLAASLMAGCGSSVSEKPGAGTANLVPSSTEFANASLLVTPESVQSFIDEGKVVTAVNSTTTGRLVIIDARSATAYASGHIPGAINMQHSAYWTKGAGLKDNTTLASQLGAAGIARNMKIVIYDNTTASWGAAGRIFWMLEYLGCTDVHIINGGWDKWLTDGRQTQTTAVTLAAATFVPQVNSAAKSDSNYISHRLYDRDFAVVDTRTDEEYMGWQLYGETRGGHIPSAVNIPYAWFYNSDKTTLSYKDLKALFESRGITPDKEVTANCTAGIRSGYVYFLLRLMGYPRCSNYDASIWDWADNTTLPEEKAPNYSTAVYPGWVKALIDYHKPGSTSAAPPQYGYDRNHKFIIFETQWGSIDDMQQGWADNSYLLGHIPGAIHSNSDTYENGYPRWFLLPDAELKTAVGSMGITADTTVVVYSDSPIFAARLWWILKYAGVADVRYLNGGIAQWVETGMPTETTINNPTATAYTGTIRPEYLATTDYVFSNYLNTTATTLVDVRTGSEYAGAISGYSYLAAMGRIPGAVWAYNADDSSLYYHDGDGTLRSYTEIEDMWRGLGITSGKELIFYCGGGYRSGLAFLYAYLMGFPNIRNYSDGWEGWSTTYTEDPSYQQGVTPGWRQDPSGRPVATGGL